VNDNVPWSAADDADMKRMIREGRSMFEVAAVLERSFGEVQQRLETLGSRMPGATPKILSRTSANKTIRL
jgi:hypothetical protein